MSNSRRTFIKTVSGAAAAATSLEALALSAEPHQKSSTGNKVRIAAIGVNGIGFENITAHLKVPDVTLVALCDIDQNILKKRGEDVKKISGTMPELLSDFRKVYERKDIDAVIISTPDHWHALQMIEACKAGKDVYVEKPVACTFEECNAMLKAADKYNRIVQVGQQQRSGTHWQNAVNYIQSGKLGKIRTVRCWVNVGWRGELPPVPDSAVPAGVDYDAWQGPAPRHPFNNVRFHNTWRFFWEYAGGYMTDWGVHLLDIAFWAMNVTGPQSVFSSGGKIAYPGDARVTPDTQIAVYDFENFLLTWEHTIGTSRGPYDKDHGIAFYGANGVLVVNRSGWEVLPEINADENKPYRAYKTEAIPFQASVTDDRYEHARNFIESVRSRKRPVCDIRTGSNVAINAQLGNIAFRLGRKIYWDNNKNEIINDLEAIKLTRTNYQNGYTLPDL